MSWVAGWAPNSIKQIFYKLGPISKGLRKTLNVAAPDGISEVIIAGGILKGFPFLLDMQSEKDYWLGNYEINLQSVLNELVQPDMTVYDIGANVGYVSLMFGKSVGKMGNVYSFEALPENQDRLKANLRLNEDQSSFHPISLAVADKTGKVDFLVHNSDDMGKITGSSGRDETYLESITIDAISIDDFVFKNGNPAPDLIKVDIEGGEIFAIPGMVKVLTQHRPTMVVELHGPKCAEVAWKHLTESNYSIHQLEKGFPAVNNYHELNWKSYLVGKPK